jgi:hypothetical protein
MKNEEEWRYIDGFESLYSISSWGRVKSHWYSGKILRPVLRSNGYLTVQLCKKGESKKQVGIHTLVAAAFIGSRPANHDVSHLDGNKLNNVSTNLCYESHKENCLRRRGHGTERIPTFAKLSESQVLEIRQLKLDGKLQREIAQAYGIDQSHVSRILSKRFWPTI